MDCKRFTAIPYFICGSERLAEGKAESQRQPKMTICAELGIELSINTVLKHTIHGQDIQCRESLQGGESGFLVLRSTSSISRPSLLLALRNTLP